MDNQLRNFYNDEMENYLEIFQKMVMTNSYTENANGVNENGKIFTEAFKGLGFSPETIQSSNPAYGKHLILTREGHSSKKIGLVTHLDTVFPQEEEVSNNFYWRREGDRIYGPGTNDIKGGTILILMVMQALQKFVNKSFNETTWIILANAAEERWSHDFGDLCRDRLGENASAALVFESGYFENNQFSLVTARKGMAVYDIVVEGKSAHAGNRHQSGANAIVQLSDIIQKVASLTDYTKDLTYNIGVVSGGTVPNRVPHLAKARGEMRTFSKDVFDQGINQLLALNDVKPIKSVYDGYSCKTDIQVTLENDPWPRNDETDKLFEIWKEVGTNLGMVGIMEERGGLSDGNQTWDFVPTLDGLGPNGSHSHCSESSPDGSKDQEFATISSFIPKAILNSLAILKLIKSN